MEELEEQLLQRHTKNVHLEHKLMLFEAEQGQLSASQMSLADARLRELVDLQARVDLLEVCTRTANCR